MAACAVEVEKIAAFAGYDNFYARARRLQREKAGFQARTLS